MKILIIDNYDSFVYNLVQYIGEQNATPIVKRNDMINEIDIKRIHPDGIIISPGPGTPMKKQDCGNNLSIIRKYYTKIPFLGVCFGHQAIIHAFNGKIIPAKNIMHGKTSEIYHTGKYFFNNILNPLTVMRYHSLVVDPSTFPYDTFDITAKTIEDNEIFAFQHKQLPIFGVQFHPESIGTYEGMKLIRNFLEICHAARSNKNSS